MSRFSSIRVAVLIITLAAISAAQKWTPIGPDGGDVRSLAADPHTPGRVLLGTSAGQLFESKDNGRSWARFKRLADRNDYVLDHIIFHPTEKGVIYVSAWSIEDNNAGDIFISADNGQKWGALKGIHNKSIRSFAMAPSNPDVLVAGTLDGVYRSNDAGANWKLISPAGHMDIRNIESVAVDPRNPEIIYAGTWHLPWKTSDGGATWKNIKQGIIDDSDVFSIIIDPQNPSTVYASACSGIYKSENAGETFRKVQGIPFSARRTRVLMQDPKQRNVVYAGTTEGLWKTVDSGTTWKRITGANIIVNDVMIDPRDTSRVLIATDRSGVLASENSGQTFVASNRGFAHRQVATLLVDRNDSATVYAGLINDKEFGGVFVSSDAGNTWKQMNGGLGGRDIFTLRQTARGDLLAGTNNGIFTAKGGSTVANWLPMNSIINVKEVPTKVGKKTVIRKQAKKDTLKARVNDVELAPAKWYAATSDGVYMSNDEGRSWHGGPLLGERDFVAVHVTDKVVVAAARKGVYLSTDQGEEWFKVTMPKRVTSLTDVTVDHKGGIILAAREGAYRSEDAGQTWKHLDRLPVNHLTSVVFDEETQKVLITSSTSTEIFESSDSGRNWKSRDTGWQVRAIRSSRGRILGATAFDGVVMMPDSNTAPAMGGEVSNTTTGGANSPAR